MNSGGFIKNTLFIILLILPNIASADEDLGRWKFGITRGTFSEKKQSGVSIEAGPLIGFEIERRFSEKIHIGFEFTRGRTEKESLSLPGFKTSYNNYFSMVFLNYRLDKVIKGLYIGPQFGIMMRSLIKGNDNIDMTAAASGFKIGCGCNLSGRVYLGLQAQYVQVDKVNKSVQEGSPSMNVVYSVPQTSFTKYLASLKYRF